MSIWRLSADRSVALDRPVLMGILNVTPDSFFDGGTLQDTESAVRRAVRMIADGADILDLGAESTRPGAERVQVAEQIRRLLPALAAIRAACPNIPISIDTTLPKVAEAALSAGADAINDVSGGVESNDEMLFLAAERGAAIVLMHRLRAPGEDRYSDQYQSTPAYDDVVATVGAFLAERAQRAMRAGVRPEGILLDPGLGFGKSVEQNLELIARTPELIARAGNPGQVFPLLSALSRKSFVGRVSLGRDSSPEERLPGTLALSVAHRAVGAAVFRVHDVAEHRAALAAGEHVRRLGETSRA